LWRFYIHIGSFKNENLKNRMTIFYRYGFGLRCFDAIRPMELIDCKPCAGYVFVELPKA